jgi:hypothetical protein
MKRRIGASEREREEHRREEPNSQLCWREMEHRSGLVFGVGLGFDIFSGELQAGLQCLEDEF